MKGTVVSTWIKTIKEQYDIDKVRDALKDAGIPFDKVFKPLENVPDEKPFTMVESLANSLNMDKTKLWKKIGEDNLITFSKNYSGFFQRENAFDFLSGMNQLHEVVMKKIDNAKPPILDMEPISQKQAYFTYRSERNMYGYFFGLLQGVIDYYDESVKVEEIKRSDGLLKVKLTFEYPIYLSKNYTFNKIFSFGFIKNINIKIGLMTLVIAGLITIPISFLPNKFQIYAMFANILASSIIASSIINLPLNLIFKDMENLKNNDYVFKYKVKSNDTYEQYFNLVNEYRNFIVSDFMGYKSMIDDLDNFGSDLSSISDTMSSTSDEISEIVDQLSQAATSQAEDTTEAVHIINENINSLQEVASTEQENKIKLESVLSEINKNFNEVQTTSNEIQDVLKQFENLRENGFELETKAKDITNIVELVSDISEQTNLLALNASIEAARAGDLGKGFAVVAEEVRKLAEETKDAVEKIGKELDLFRSNINSLVENIDSQYTVLEKENNSLNEVVSNSKESNDKMEDVSKEMIMTAEKLENETNEISKVFERIESLAAIAEENSSSSQEVSASVMTYTEEIKNLSDHINEIKALTSEFSKDISKYKV